MVDAMAVACSSACVAPVADACCGSSASTRSWISSTSSLSIVCPATTSHPVHACASGSSATSGLHSRPGSQCTSTWIPSAMRVAIDVSGGSRPTRRACRNVSATWRGDDRRAKCGRPFTNSTAQPARPTWECVVPRCSYMHPAWVSTVSIILHVLTAFHASVMPVVSAMFLVTPTSAPSGVSWASTKKMDDWWTCRRSLFLISLPICCCRRRQCDR